jgi:hypothetical protein
MLTKMSLTFLACCLALPALAQPMPPGPAGAEQAAQSNAAVAHHERAVAHRAARHGNYRKAAAAKHAAHAAQGAANADAAAAGAPPPR